MATIENDRDNLLQGAPVRDTNPGGDKFLIVTATAETFQVTNPGGVGTPTSITFTAKPINMPGTVAWSSTPSVTLTGSGNTRTLSFTDFGANTSVTIQAEITYKGLTYTAVKVISRTTDGATGSTGSRGAGHFYATGSSWSDSVADAATPGANIAEDRVTISDGSWVLTKYWTGSAWVADGTVIDGNLIVTGSITAAKINANGLTIRDPSGNVILNAGSTTNVMDWAAIFGGGKPENNANYTTATSQLTDDANLGGTATWSGVTGSGKPADNATVNTGLFATLAGQLTSGNIGTYLAANAVGSTYIASLAATKITAGTLAAGVIYAGDIVASQVTSGTFTGLTFQTASSGQRAVLSASSNNLVTYDSSGNTLVTVGGGGSGSVYVSYVSGTLPGVYANVSTSAAAIAGDNASGSSLSSGGQFTGYTGVKGAGATGYDFYAAGAATNYGPFTGAHDVLFWPGEDIDLGDIVLDAECVEHGGLSNTIFRVETSTQPYQKGAVGVLSVQLGDLADHLPAVFSQQIEQPDSSGKARTVVIPTERFHEVKDLYWLGACNSLGEGQLSVCGEGGDIEVGDFIVTSSMPGKGMRMDMSLPVTFDLQSCIVARAREAVTFSRATEVKRVACIYLCG